MKLILKQVRFWNFMSFGNAGTVIDLNTHSTTLIVGKNGGGKSSAILDTISFVLFNKPFRDIRKPQLMNSINGKNCLVELDFSIGGVEYMVRRGIKPDIFEIIRDGKLVIKPADNKDYQADFEKTVIKINHKTFCQIVMLGSNIFIPFMALKTPERRAVIEDILDLKVCSVMNAILSKRAKECNNQLKEINASKDVLENSILIAQRYINESIKNNDATILEKQEMIDQWKKQAALHIETIEDNNARSAELVTQIGNIEALNKKFEQLKKLQYQLQTKVRQVGTEIKFLVDNETCPTCKQVIDDEFKASTVKEKTSLRSNLTEGLSELDEKYVKLENDINAITAIQKEIQLCQQYIRDAKINLASIERNITNVNNEIVKLSEVNETIDLSELEEMVDQLTEVKEQLIELEDDKTVMSYAAMMLKDTGFKSQIIKTYIPIINTLIAKYLAALDFFVSFELDENFDETIKSRFRDDFSYMSFSEGEKCRLNVAILFAWRAISKLRGSIDCNLIVLDELFDSSLDVTGIDDMLKLLNNLTDNENVFIISHREDQISDKFARVIRFKKQNLFSEMEI